MFLQILNSSQFAQVQTPYICYLKTPAQKSLFRYFEGIAILCTYSSIDLLTSLFVQPAKVVSIYHRSVNIVLLKLFLTQSGSRNDTMKFR